LPLEAPVVAATNVDVATYVSPVVPAIVFHCIFVVVPSSETVYAVPTTKFPAAMVATKSTSCEVVYVPRLTFVDDDELILFNTQLAVTTSFPVASWDGDVPNLTTPYPELMLVAPIITVPVVVENKVAVPVVTLVEMAAVPPAVLPLTVNVLSTVAVPITTDGFRIVVTPVVAPILIAVADVE